MNLSETNNLSFCYKTANIWQTVGYIILILKIVIPIIIIILGIIDLSKAIIASDDKAIKIGLTNLAKRIAAGVLILLLPTIINLAFKLISDFVNSQGDYNNCVTCLTSPNNECDTSYKPEIIGFN